MKTDRELIGAYRNGDEHAFEEFYRRHRKPVFVYLLSLLRSRETAEEVHQETFFAFLRHLHRLDGSADYRPYLLRTARSRAIDRLRQEKRASEALEKHLEDPLFKARAAGEVRPAEAVEPLEWSKLLFRLPDEQREAVVLRIFSDLRFPEIARLLAVPESTVISRYRYGLEKLRGMIGGG